MLSANRIAHLWTHTRATMARRLFLDRQMEFWAQTLDPARSLAGVRARVTNIVCETSDTKTFVLQPNSAWRGHRAGQYTSVEVEIDGVRTHRCYSISSAPGPREIAITVKRIEGGRVSPWLHEHLQIGDVVGLGPATGEFVLPPATPDKLLLLSGGSGITPVMSILRDRIASADADDIVFVHHARSRADVIFGDELEELADRHRGIKLFLCLDDDDFSPLGFDESRLAVLVPDFAERATYLCGPAGLMDRAEAMWRDAGATRRLSRERFVAAPSFTALAGAGDGVGVHLARSGRSVATDGSGTLLEQLEAAGERPESGCRMGICHTCTCRKQSGTVENLLTGEISSEPDQDIQLCISVPRSDLALEL